MFADQSFLSIALAGCAGFTIGGLTFTKAYEMLVNPILHNGRVRGNKLALELLDERDRNAALTAQIEKHKADCAKGGKTTAAKRSALVAQTTERLKAQVAAGQLQPLRPRHHVVSGVAAQRANKRWATTFHDVLDNLRNTA